MPATIIDPSFISGQVGPEIKLFRLLRPNVTFFDALRFENQVKIHILLMMDLLYRSINVQSHPAYTWWFVFFNLGKSKSHCYCDKVRSPTTYISKLANFICAFGPVVFLHRNFRVEALLKPKAVLQTVKCLMVCLPISPMGISTRRWCRHVLEFQPKVVSQLARKSIKICQFCTDWLQKIHTRTSWAIDFKSTFRWRLLSIFLVSDTENYDFAVISEKNGFFEVPWLLLGEQQ